MKNCYNTGNVIAESTSTYSTSVYAGGISGKPLYVNMSDCYNTGDILAMNTTNANGYGGGIVGINGKGGNVRSCYSTGSVGGVPYYGGIAGTADDISYMQGCFWEKDADHSNNGQLAM